MTGATIRVVGLGPGDPRLLTFQAAEALDWAQTIVGYKGYVSLIADEVLAGKQVVSTAMTGEMERTASALDHALAGERTVVVGSGDAGVYGLAGLVFELARERGVLKDLDIEVVPGVPALMAAAALLGAPLVHDFAAISLSDLLTPWERIESRLMHAAAGDFVIGLYNPRSKRRDWQLERAREIMLEHRDPATPVGVVRNAFRPGQETLITSLEEMEINLVDMFSLLVVGNSQTMVIENHLVTPRGYLGKYNAETLQRRQDK